MMRVSTWLACLAMALLVSVCLFASGERGTPLEATADIVAGDGVKPIASFDDRNPFSGGTVVAMHATTGRRGAGSTGRISAWIAAGLARLRLPQSRPFTDAKKPINLDVEVRDTGTRDYWTRVNYTTIVPPGISTLIIPLKQLYVGEKSGPGRMLNLKGVTRLVFGIGDNPPAPLFVDNVRLERDLTTARRSFDGLHAFDFGTGTSPVMEGFTQVTPATSVQSGPRLRAQRCPGLARLRRPSA